MAEVELTSFEVCLQQLLIAVEASDHEEAKAQLQELHPGEVARILEALTPRERSFVWPGIDISIQGEALKEVNEDVQSQLIDEM